MTAPPPRTPNRWAMRLHFLVRLLGLTGLLAVGVGGLLQAALASGADTATVEHFSHPARLCLTVGGGVAAFALLIELIVGLRTAAGRRSATGLNAWAQIALATVLLVAVNAFSFRHYVKWDVTRDQQFTLPPAVADELRKLRSDVPTTVVVYQRHKTFGSLSDKPDAYDYAAERKVVEKVRDLVDQFRELGPQFRVVVLDVEEEGFDQKLAELTKDTPELRAAIDSAPENSIFFAANGRVQRLSFNDFYQLDKTASVAANDGKGNLVLLNQGIEPFARRVRAIEEKRPKVGIAVIHEELTTQGASDELTLAGMKKSLELGGFEVKDIVLKKWEGREPEPAVSTFEESKLDRVEGELADLEANLKTLRTLEADRTRAIEIVSKATLENLTRMLAQQLRGRRATEQIRRILIEQFEDELEGFREGIREISKAVAEVESERTQLLASEATVEGRRMTDLRAKLDRMTADCDLLFVPRITLINLPRGYRIPSRLYRLDSAQVDAVRDFLKSGKPVLAAFGPGGDPDSRRSPLDPDTGGDDLESLFSRLGFRFGEQTVLYTSEGRAFAERRAAPLGGGGVVDVPALSFDRPLNLDRRLGGARALPGEEAAPPDNPIQKAMRITARSTGRKLELKPRHPRPVYFVWNGLGKQPFAAEFAWTDADAWNESNPFPSQDYTPRFEPAKPTDPSKGTFDEERRGPFPVAVAVETTVPAEWLSPKVGAMAAAVLTTSAVVPLPDFPHSIAAASLVPNDAYAPTGLKRPTVRVAAIGHGGLFAGPELSPARERLLLATCNWLLKRDERLPKDESTWTYPRVELSPFGKALWTWGISLGLPVLFAYLGLVMLMIRRYR